jgi:hypothetical protein
MVHVVGSATYSVREKNRAVAHHDIRRIVLLTGLSAANTFDIRFCFYFLSATLKRCLVDVVQKLKPVVDVVQGQLMSRARSGSNERFGVRFRVQQSSGRQNPRHKSARLPGSAESYCGRNALGTVKGNKRVIHHSKEKSSIYCPINTSAPASVFYRAINLVFLLLGWITST